MVSGDHLHNFSFHIFAQKSLRLKPTCSTLIHMRVFICVLLVIIDIFIIPVRASGKRPPYRQCKSEGERELCLVELQWDREFRAREYTLSGVLENNTQIDFSRVVLEFD